MWPFKTQSTLSLEDEEWQIQTWRWLLDVLGGREDLKRQLFVQPTPNFFHQRNQRDTTVPCMCSRQCAT